MTARTAERSRSFSAAATAPTASKRAARFPCRTPPASVPSTSTTTATMTCSSPEARATKPSRRAKSGPSPPGRVQPCGCITAPRPVRPATPAFPCPRTTPLPLSPPISTATATKTSSSPTPRSVRRRLSTRSSTGARTTVSPPAGAASFQRWAPMPSRRRISMMIRSRTWCSPTPTTAKRTTCPPTFTGAVRPGTPATCGLSYKASERSA